MTDTEASLRQIDNNQAATRYICFFNNISSLLSFDFHTQSTISVAQRLLNVRCCVSLCIFDLFQQQMLSSSFTGLSFTAFCFYQYLCCSYCLLCVNIELDEKDYDDDDNDNDDVDQAVEEILFHYYFIKHSVHLIRCR